MDLSSIFALLFIGIIGNTKAFVDYKWISLKTGDKMPENSVGVAGWTNKFVGRARHYDDILPAEIYPNGTAFVSTCGKEISKDQFEILITSGGCQWREESEIDINENTLLSVGTAWNGEPIFIATFFRDRLNGEDPYSIYYTSGKTFRWLDASPSYIPSHISFLCCNIKPKWIEYSPEMKLPNNTVFAARSWHGKTSYVARLKRGCDLIAGQFVPEEGVAKAILYDGSLSKSRNFDLLIGEPNEYSWTLASNGRIPDYAVVLGKNESQPVYVGRIDSIVRQLTHLEALKRGTYEILVMNREINAYSSKLIKLK